MTTQHHRSVTRTSDWEHHRHTATITCSCDEWEHTIIDTTPIIPPRINHAWRNHIDQPRETHT